MITRDKKKEKKKKKVTVATIPKYSKTGLGVKLYKAYLPPYYSTDKLKSNLLGCKYFCVDEKFWEKYSYTLSKTGRVMSWPPSIHPPVCQSVIF